MGPVMSLPFLVKRSVETPSVSDSGQSIRSGLKFQQAVGLLYFEFSQFALRNIVMGDDNAQESVNVKSSDPNAKPALLGG